MLLDDQYGPANARASSGGESRAIRMSYGPDELYTRFSWRSLALWKALFAEIGRPELFQKTGVLWMTKGDDPNATASLRALVEPLPPPRELVVVPGASHFFDGQLDAVQEAVTAWAATRPWGGTER